MIASPLAPKWPILIPFCGLDHQKSKFLLVSCNFDVRGCWGQPILLFWKNIDKTQMSPSPECAATFFWTWKSTLVGHLGLQSMSYRVGTPCTIQNYCLEKETLLFLKKTFFSNVVKRNLKEKLYYVPKISQSFTQLSESLGNYLTSVFLSSGSH